MDLDMELNPKPKKSAGCRKGGRAVLLAVVAATMFGSGYLVGNNGFGLGGFRLLPGPRAVAANTAAPTTSPSPPAEPTPAPAVTATAPPPASTAKEPRRLAAGESPVAEHGAKPVAKKPTPAPTPAAVASKNAAANARPAAAARQPAARFQPSTATLSVLDNTLKQTRSQLELYNLQHHDQYPTLAQLQKEWSVLTKPTDADGKVMLAAGRSTFGPYLKQPPVNPITNSARVAAPGKAGADTGWTYDEQTGLFKAVLPSHVIAPALDLESVERVGG